MSSVSTSTEPAGAAVSAAAARPDRAAAAPDRAVAASPDRAAGAPSEDAGGPHKTAYIWSLTLRDLLLIALLAALCVVGKMVLRIPLHISGHSGVLWVAVFVIARGLVDKRGAGILLGVVAGILAQFAGFGQSGPFEWTKWVAAGIILELMVVILPGDLRSFPKAIVTGAALHLGKLAALTIAGLILQTPWVVLFAGLGASAALHVVFGAVGGFLGALALRELRKVPFLDAQARGH